ncbi:MAG TPA: catalase family peroxidase, partial [Gammaproteobacteria bacterium]|nr:catalase family peroxidase [Gammaproteobacteria bacterium]
CVTSRPKRLSRILAAAAITLSIALSARPQSAPPGSLHPQTPEDLVAALHAAFGQHHARAVHAKGILLEGVFKPSEEGKALSRAPIFASGTLPLIARFSDFTGIPDIPDTATGANPRGFAIKIRANGGDVDVVTHSFNGFPVASSDEFAVFLRAIAASGPGVPHPTPIEQFLDHNPTAKQFVTSQKPPPVSYATIGYFGVNAFKFTNEAGRSTFVRYRFVPRTGEHYLSPQDVQAKGPNYLLEELPRRVAEAPVVFDWYAQLAEQGDATDNPSIAWPESRKQVLLGTLTLTRTAGVGTDSQTLFLPGTAHPGIEPADPMLTLRNDAYPISFNERQ